MEPNPKNIYVIQSVWRRIKKAKIRDLEPVKDVKGGGGGVADKSTPDTGGKGSTGSR